MRPQTTAPRTPGFSLVEVMIALIIISVGLLGIAKLEAVVLSSTGTSRLRALVALQAESLADAMPTAISGTAPPATGPARWE